MTPFLLPLFPENGLAASITTTVWIGVWVVAFYNLRLGWTLTGLVVPGYLVPLLLIKPLAAGVVLGEAVLTYTLVATLSEYRHLKPWTSLFGRDRFFALVLVSILVRGAMDGFLLPMIGDALTLHYGWQLSFRDDLHSFGLIIVSLIANYFWKPGLFRGLIPLSVTVGTTYLIVRFGLVPWTNFSIGNLQFMYEEIAASLLASPKAYIILITTAFIASRMNRNYGWDFNGILIPALIATEWAEPFKILITFIEAFTVLAISATLLRLPMFQRVTMEGARKTLLFFNVTFGIRLLLGHLLPLLFPEIKVTDLFGFGYLLSTLLAVKMHDKGLYLRIPRVSLQVSLTGAVAGSMIGFLMTQWVVVQTHRSSIVVQAALTRLAPISAERTLVDAVRAEQPRLHRHHADRTNRLPQPTELAAFVRGLTTLPTLPPRLHAEANHLWDDETLRLRWEQAVHFFETANYELQLVESRYALLRELEPCQQRGTYVIDLSRSKGLIVEVPSPREEWGTTESGLLLFRSMTCRGLAIAGTDLGFRQGLPTVVLSEPGTMFEAFHRTLTHANVLTVRGKTDAPAAALLTAAASNSEIETTTPPTSAATANTVSRLWVKRSLPTFLELPRLAELLPDFQLEWQTSPNTDILRDAVWTGHAELSLSPLDCQRLVARIDESFVQDNSASVRSPAGWLREQIELILPRGSNLYRPAIPEELFFFDAEVLQPLLEVVLSERTSDAWTESDQRRLASAASAARVLNYRLLRFDDRAVRGSSGDEYLALVEADTSTTRRGWGTYLFRLGEADATAVEVPRPVLEQWTAEYGLSLFQSQRARVLMLAGAHPQANADRSADIIAETNSVTLFNLIRQTVIREVDPRPWRQLQIRAFSTPLDVDVLLAPAVPSADVTEGFDDVLQRMAKDGWKVRVINGGPETAGYESTNPLLVKSLRLGRQSRAVLLWLAPHVRKQFRSQAEDRLQTAEFTALGIPTLETDLTEHLVRTLQSRRLTPFDGPFVPIVAGYLESRNIVELRRLQHLWASAAWTRVIDVDTGRSYLIGLDERHLICVSLSELPATGPHPLQITTWSNDNAREFIRTRATWSQSSEVQP